LFSSRRGLLRTRWNGNQIHLKRAILVFASFIIALVIAYSTRLAPRWLRTSVLRVSVPGLADGLDGMRVAHLSDFHLGARWMTTCHLHQARSIAFDFRPDLIALTGDYYDGGGSSVESEGLFSGWPAGVPVVAVMGNHDRRGPAGTLELTVAELRKAGATVLNNASIRLAVRQGDVWIAGVDDPHTFNANVSAALEDVPSGAGALFVLSHAPAVIEELVPGQASILLAGHTHGGQVRLLPSGAVPFVDLIRKVAGAPGRPDGPVYRRWHWLNGTVVLVSDGLGVSTLPLRFRTRPHLVLIELRTASQDDAGDCDSVERYVQELQPEPWLLRWLT
jgi:uncharacterized protein